MSALVQTIDRLTDKFVSHFHFENILYYIEASPHRHSFHLMNYKFHLKLVSKRYTEFL